MTDKNNIIAQNATAASSRSPANSERACPKLLEHIIFWGISAGGLGFDLWTKREVFEWLSNMPDRSIVLINGVVSFVTALNSGAAFGIATGRTGFLKIISAAALVVILIIFLFGIIRGKLFSVALGMLAAGVAGNLYDRMFNSGHVRDFIDVHIGRHHWPAFNVADSLLCIGVGLILILTLLGHHEKSKKDT